MKKHVRKTLARAKHMQAATVQRSHVAGRHVASKFVFLRTFSDYVIELLRALGRAIVRISPPWLRKVGSIAKRPFSSMKRRINTLLARRPHRSFRRTRRRDYKRSLTLPGYWSFTNNVRAMLWRNKKLFGGLMLSYFLIILAIQGFGQQDAYKNLSDTLNQSGKEIFTGNWGKIGQAGLLLATSISTGLTPNVTQAQSVLGGLTVFLAWLAAVWALRNVMAGHKVRVRDAVYASGSPIISTVIVGFTLVLQLLPVAIAVLIYVSAVQSEFISGGAEQMLLWCVLVLLGVLSLYWITSTIIALVVVTLPGMYPFQAIRTAGDLVVGRRLRILLRLVWHILFTVIIWVVIAIPIILLDAWLKSVWPVISGVPVVPVTILFMSAVTIIATAAYVYMLYRKVVDDDAKPA